MTTEPKTLISSCMELLVRDKETKYQFYERSGMNLSDGLTPEEADRAAYLEIFGVEFEP